MFGSNPCGDEIFCTRPDRSWDPPSPLYNAHRLSFLGVKRSGRGVDYQPASRAKINENVEIHFYSPSAPSRPVIGRTSRVMMMMMMTIMIIIIAYTRENQNVKAKYI